MLSWNGLLLFALVGLVIHMLGRAAGSLTPLLVTQHFEGGAAEFGWPLSPPDMQGRVFSLIHSTTQLVAPFGLLVAGPVADRWGVGFWWVLTGLTISLLGPGALLVPSVVHLEDRQTSPHLT